MCGAVFRAKPVPRIIRSRFLKKHLVPSVRRGKAKDFERKPWWRHPFRCRPGAISKRGINEGSVPAMSAQKTKPAPASAAHMNELLDEALEETFPASDPIAVGVELQPVEQPDGSKNRQLPRQHTKESAECRDTR